MGKVYGLKRATPRMKWVHMNYVVDWKADLKEQQAKYAMEKLLERQAELMTELMELDMAWEAWFDNDDNVPEFGTVQSRIVILEKRIADLKTSQPLIPLMHSRSQSEYLAFIMTE